MSGEITYDYRDLEDRLVYQVVRKTGKKFLQRRRENDDWVWNLDGITPVPYRWPELDLAADELSDWVWVVEGEKDADRLAHHGLIATTSAKGAAWEWPAEWAQHFAGFERVIVIADNDDIGLKAARQRAAVIATAVHDVRVIDRMPDVDDKGDVSDWLDAGGTIEDLYKLGEYAPQFQLAREMPADSGEYDDRPPPTEDEPEPVQALDVIWVEDAIDDPPEEPPVLIDGFLRAGELAVIVAPRKIGKAQPLTTKVATPSGWRPMGDIKAGDQVIGRDGTATEVLEVHPQGTVPIYRLQFSDRSSVRACGDHLWSMHRRDDRVGKLHTFTTWQLFERMRTGVGEDLLLPMVEPVEYDPVDLPVDPYLLGLLLGDGGLTKGICFTSGDPELFDAVRRLVPEGCEVRTINNQAVQIVGAQRGTNPLIGMLRDLDLFGHKSERKHLPRPYLLGSAADRFALLQGLMDTDGYQAARTVQFTTSSPRLAHDVTELVESLGGTARTVSKIPTYRHHGELLRGLRSYTLSIKLPEHLGAPFRLARKVEAHDRRPGRRYRPTRRLVSVTYVGEMPAQCITVAAPDHLYVTERHIVTHNSWTAFNLALLLSVGMGKLFGKLSVREQCKVLIAQGELDRYGSASRWSYLTGKDNPLGADGPPVHTIAETFERWRLRTVRKTVTGVDTHGRTMREEFFEATLDPRLEETIVEHGIDVLIIDPWAVFFAGSENNNDEVEAALGQLRALAERTGVAIVIVHHISKVGEVREPEDLWRGASRLADWASTGLTMLPHYKQEKGKGGWGSIEGMTRQKARRFVDLHFMRRSTPTEDFSIEWNPRNGWWEQWEPTIRKDSDTAQDSVRLIDEAAAQVIANGGFASTAEAVRITGWGHEKVRRIYGQAAAAGLIRKDDSGKATAWFPKVTSLFDPPPHDDRDFERHNHEDDHDEEEF